MQTKYDNIMITENCKGLLQKYNKSIIENRVNE